MGNRQALKKTNRLTGFSGKNYIVFVTAVVIAGLSALPPAIGQAGPSDKEAVLSEVASKWIVVAKEHYSRGQYGQAERSLQYALDYQEYLSVGQSKQIEGLLETIRQGMAKRKDLQQQIDAGEKLIDEGRVTEARAKLEEIELNPSLSRSQRGQIGAGLKRIDGQFQRSESRIAELYDRGMGHYRSGNFDKARQNFIEAGDVVAEAMEKSQPTRTKAKVPAARPAEPIWSSARQKQPATKEPSKPLAVAPSYPVIPEAVATPAPAPVVVKRSQPFEFVVTPKQRVEPKAKPWFEPKKIEKPAAGKVKKSNKPLTRKEKIVRSYVSAVIKDATIKARDYLSAGRLEQAQNTLENTLQIVRQNREYLGEELFTQYDIELQQLTEAALRGGNGSGRR